MESQHRRDTNVMIYIRRLAMCARKLGKLKEAVKMFKDLPRKFPYLMHVLNIHENLQECLLEMGNYADVQAVLAKYDDNISAQVCRHLLLLLRCSRLAPWRTSSADAGKRGLTQV